jgi:hypothetical protein
MRNKIDYRGFIEERDDTTTSLTIDSGNITIIGSLVLSGSTSLTTASLNTQLNPTWIPDPGANRNANTTALALYNAGEAISIWAPTALRTIDPSDAPSSMAFTVIKINTAAFGVQVSGSGWTGNGTLYNSDQATSGSWLVRLDKPNKIIISTPGA